jgi:alpha-beta hydrolase superfamily lysophospholipase
MTRFEINVSEVAPLGGRFMVGDVFADANLDIDDPIVLVCLPGGGMSRRYFDLRVPAALGNFSMARHLASAGFVVVTLDHLGIGESSKPLDGYLLTPETVADVNAFAVGRVLDDLRAGTLDPSLPPLPALVSVGVGHSAGASLTVHQQARWFTHRAIALLGFGGRGLPDRLGEAELAFADNPDALRREIAQLARARFGDPLPMQRRGSSSFLVGAPMPEAVHEALVDCRTNLLALVGLSSMVPGNATPEIASIDVPVFLGIGSRDIAGPPHQIAAQFTGSGDVTLFVLDDAGHNHNVAPGRGQLWDRLAAWARTVAGTRRAAGTRSVGGTDRSGSARGRASQDEGGRP